MLWVAHRLEELARVVGLTSAAAGAQQWDRQVEQCVDKFRPLLESAADFGETALCENWTPTQAKATVALAALCFIAGVTVGAVLVQVGSRQARVLRVRDGGEAVTDDGADEEDVVPFPW